MVLDRAVRAFDPVPGAFTSWLGQPLKVWAAEPMPGTIAGTQDAPAPGTIVAVGAAGIDVACGDGLLRVRTVQPAGGKRMAASAFAAGRALAPGARFGAEADAP